MSLYRYVNSAPSLSVSPSISPDHHARTLLMAAKASSGVWSTEMVVVKFFFFMNPPSLPILPLDTLLKLPRSPARDREHWHLIGAINPYRIDLLTPASTTLL